MVIRFILIDAVFFQEETGEILCVWQSQTGNTLMVMIDTSREKRVIHASRKLANVKKVHLIDYFCKNKLKKPDGVWISQVYRSTLLMSE